MTTPDFRLLAIPIDFFLAALIYTLYYPVLSGPFLFDDLSVLSDFGLMPCMDPSKSKRDILILIWRRVYATFKGFLTLRGLAYLPSTRLLTWISFSVDAMYCQGHTRQWHRTSILLHILNTILTLHIVLALTGNLLLASVSAALFALHPMSTMAVAYIAARSTVLATTFSLAAVLTVASGYWAVSAVFYFFAILSKEEALLLPILLVAVAAI